MRSHRPFLDRFGIVAQVVFGLAFAGAIALSMSSCEPRAAETPLNDTAHAHYHVHGPGIEHGHVHADFASGGHTHGHEHPWADELP